MRDWRARNPEKVNAIAAACRQRNRAKIAVSWKRYYQKNKAKLYEQKKAYVARNAEKLRKWRRADYERHRESYIARAHRRWREKNDECRAYDAMRWQRDKEKMSARRRDYMHRNRQNVLAWQRAYAKTPRGRAVKQASDRRCAGRVAAYKNAWARRNRAKITRHFRIRRQTDVEFAIRGRVRARINIALRRYPQDPRLKLSASLMTLLGCTGNELIQYLESKFSPGMSWENRKLWHIDHIRPLASFDLMDAEQQSVACHYTNLQPLWAVDNFRKGGRWHGNANAPILAVSRRENPATHSVHAHAR